MPAPIPIDSQILALHNAGVPTRQIEKVIGSLDHSTIARRLQRLTPRKTTEIYRELKAEVLEEKTRQLLMQSQRLPPREQDQVSRAFKVYNDALRLERGQSTGNLSVQAGISQPLQDALDRLIMRLPVSPNAGIVAQSAPIETVEQITVNDNKSLEVHDR